MIRPEVAALLRRWREPLAGGALVALGLWWLSGHGLMPYVGAAVALGGALLVWFGVQRVRFASGGGGAGVVTLDEGEVTYMGPLSGGTLALADLKRLDLDPTARPDAVWVLSAPGTTLHVPVTALGADRLLDAFARLPGLRTGRLLAELERGGDVAVTVWERPAEAAARARLTLH